MRILLVGEYSRLHNSLKEGLLALGHEVVLASDGDDFKQYPSDISYAPRWAISKQATLLRKGIHWLSGIDIADWERGYRFRKLLSKLKDFDVVQLINERAIKTRPATEKKILDVLFQNNGKAFLLCCGTDSVSMQAMVDGKFRYSILTPYFDGHRDLSYDYMFRYLSKSHLKLVRFLHTKISGIIASDLDYAIPMDGHPKYVGLIPNPVNVEKIPYTELPVNGKIRIVLGINSYTAIKKGIPFFLKALDIVERRFPVSVEVKRVENLPYSAYSKILDDAHILLDQVYAYDQGYNALEAMAKGKVVFTGAETEFYRQYGLTEDVAINALPNVEDLVERLAFLIENPEHITRIGRNARKFVETEHDYIRIAQKYLDTWTTN